MKELRKNEIYLLVFVALAYPLFFSARLFADSDIESFNNKIQNLRGRFQRAADGSQAADALSNMARSIEQNLPPVENINRPKDDTPNSGQNPSASSNEPMSFIEFQDQQERSPINTEQFSTLVPDAQEGDTRLEIKSLDQVENISSNINQSNSFLGPLGLSLERRQGVEEPNVGVQIPEDFTVVRELPEFDEASGRLLTSLREGSTVLLGASPLRQDLTKTAETNSITNPALRAVMEQYAVPMGSTKQFKNGVSQQVSSDGGRDLAVFQYRSNRGLSARSQETLWHDSGLSKGQNSGRKQNGYQPRLQK